MATNFILKSVAGAKRIEINGTLVAGRNPDCDIVLSVGHPSRRHAELSLEADRVWVKDLGSANGTFVNDTQIKDRYALNAGDRIRFDAEEYVLESSAPPATDNATVLRSPADAAGHQTVIAQNRPRTPAAGPTLMRAAVRVRACSIPLNSTRSALPAALRSPWNPSMPRTWLCSPVDMAGNG
ncbi:MAG: FHA domain-containing protein [Gammaproteobacteria bacterium]|nr:FHA domain-containing protein [Gammaproteobacteria bacterium]